VVTDTTKDAVIRRRVLLNTLSNYVGQVFTLGIWFFLTPSSCASSARARTGCGSWSARWSPTAHCSTSVLRPDETTLASTASDSTYSLATHLSRPGASASTTFLYVGSLADRNVLAGQVTLRGAGCGGATLQLSAVNAQNHIAAVMNAVPLRSHPSAITIAFPRQDTDYLLLNVSSVDEPGTESCLLSLDQLKVTAR